MPVWEELAGGARAVGRSFRLQVWLRANLLGTLVSGLAFFFAVAVAHRRRSWPPRGWPTTSARRIGFGSPRARTILAWGALAAPALVGLSPWWWVIVAGLLLWPYFEAPGPLPRGRGRGLPARLPLAVRERAALLTLSERPLLAAVVQVREGNWTAADYDDPQGARPTAGPPACPG